MKNKKSSIQTTKQSKSNSSYNNLNANKGLIIQKNGYSGKYVKGNPYDLIRGGIKSN